MQHVVLRGFDPATLAGAVGAGSFARGFQYAQQGAVLHAEWDSLDSALRGAVRGSGSNIYTTVAYFSGAGGGLAYEHGECTCPVGYDCKHAAALVLTATAAMAPWAASLRSARPESGPLAAVLPESPRSLPWQRSLDSLLGNGAAGAAARPGQTPLAIELTLSSGVNAVQARASAVAGAPPRLLARLVRPGRSGRWISGNLSWGRLDALTYQNDYPERQVRLIRELHALYRSRGSRPGYHGYYAYGDERSLELSAFESRHLWPLLDEAEAIGLRLVYGRGHAAVDRYRDAELCLDVTRRRPGGPLAVTPVIHVDGEPAGAVPVTFIGSEAHGLVYADPAEAAGGGAPDGWRFRLARLALPVPPQLQRMTLAGQQLEVPAGEEAEFCEGYCPRLRQAATVISSDGSFTPPEISGPVLMLQARYGDGHHVEIGWEWAYQVGGTRLCAPLRPGAGGDAERDGYRDPGAELAILESLQDLPLARFGLLRPGQPPAGQPPAGGPPALTPRMRLGGMDTMRFTTELLPLLADHPGVQAEVTGDPADYREAGDSLRIAVSTDEVAGDTDWFDLGVVVTVEGRELPFRDLFLALSRGEDYLLLADGAYFSLDKPELRALARLIEEARALRDTPGGGLRISRYQAGLWDELAGLGVVDHQAASWQAQVQGLLSGGGPGAAEPPASLQARLRPYQRDGFGWLAFLWAHGLGGILADDMGLGKTLQCLALICYARQARPAAPPFLIVAPTSVGPNWAAEAARFAPGLTVVTVSATEARRGRPLAELAAGADAVVTSYTLLRIDFAAYAEREWSGLLLDEAQHAKNHQSKIYQCIRRLAAPVKIAITGTPLENNLMELWALLSITAPGLFPHPARFRDYYARPIEKQRDAGLLAQLQRRIRPLVRRRTKEQVLADLPAKQEQVLEVDLHPQHRKLYQTHLQRERQKVLGLLGDLDANRFTIFRSLTLLRQLSLHAGLIGGEHRDMPCSKIDALAGQLREVVAVGHRALVFSQFTGFLGHVRARLDADGVRYCYLDGRTRNRAAVLREFTGGTAPVFLISLKAGGFGLNLTEADYCFLLDPWWNPATETQAVDRAHRIGQTRNVMVYRLVARDTIEEKVMALKARKGELFSSVMDRGNVFGASLQADDIRGLFD